MIQVYWFYLFLFLLVLFYYIWILYIGHITKFWGGRASYDPFYWRFYCMSSRYFLRSLVCQIYNIPSWLIEEECLDIPSLVLQYYLPSSFWWSWILDDRLICFAILGWKANANNSLMILMQWQTVICHKWKGTERYKERKYMNSSSFMLCQNMAKCHILNELLSFSYWFSKH